jgi:transcription initiation factor IIF auxiliary subunit
MRTHYKSEMLSDERLNLLRQLGFEFREEDSDKPESAKSPKSAKSKLKSAKTNEERQIQLLKMCQQALTQTRDENRRLLEENKRKSEEISEQADTINRLKATIRALAS